MKDRLKSAAKKAIMGTARAAGKVMKAKYLQFKQHQEGQKQKQDL